MLRRVLLLSTLVLIPVAMAAGQAPGEPSFHYLQVTTRVVKPGEQPRVEEFYRKLREAEAKLQRDGLTDVYVVAQGGRVGTFVAVRPFRQWHALDTDLAEHSRDTLTRALGEAEARRLALALAAATESLTSEILRVSPELSRWHAAPTGRPWPYLQVRRTVIKPGMQAQYDAVAAKVREVRAAANAVPELRWSVVEGQGLVQGTTRYFRGWQDRDLWEDELSATLAPEDAARWRSEFYGAIERTETIVLQHRPDLSRRPTGAASTQ